MRPYRPALAREGRRLEIKRGRARGISPTCVALRGDGGGARRTCSLNGGCDQDDGDRTDGDIGKEEEEDDDDDEGDENKKEDRGEEEREEEKVGK